MSKKRKGMFANDEQRKAIFASINKEQGMSKTKVRPFGMTQNTDVKGIFKNVNKVGQEHQKIKAGGGMAIKIDTPKVKKSSLNKFDPKLNYGKKELKYNKMNLNEKTSFKLNEPGIYSAHLEESMEPEVVVTGKNAAITFEDDENLTSMLIKTEDNIESVKPQKLESPSLNVGADVKEVDGSKTTVFVSQNPTARENQKRLLQDKSKKSLEKVYSDLTKEKTSPKWSKDEVIDAIIDEKLDEKGRIRNKEILAESKRSKITQTKNRKPGFMSSRPKSKLYETKKKVASMSQIETEMIKRKLPLTEENIWNVIEDKYDMDDFRKAHTTIAAFMDMMDAGHKPNKVMKKK